MSSEDKIFEYGSRQFLNEYNPSLTAFVCSTVYGYCKDNRLEIDANITMSDCSDRINIEFSNYQWANDKKDGEDYETTYDKFKEKSERMMDKYDLLIDEIKKARTNYKKAHDKICRMAERKIRNNNK